MGPEAHQKKSPAGGFPVKRFRGRRASLTSPDTSHPSSRRLASRSRARAFYPKTQERKLYRRGPRIPLRSHADHTCIDKKVRHASIGPLAPPFKRALLVLIPRAAARYLQVKHFVLERIAAGALRAGARVPSENELVRELDVSRMTANRALQRVRRRWRADPGRRRQAPSSPSNVCKRTRWRFAILPMRFVCAATNTGVRCSPMAPLPPRASWPSASSVKPGATARSLRSSPTSRRPLPLQLEDRYVNPTGGAWLPRQTIFPASPRTNFSCIAPLQRAEHTVRALAAGASASGRLLKLEPDDACLLIMPAHFLAVLSVSPLSPISIIPVLATSSPRLSAEVTHHV